LDNKGPFSISQIKEFAIGKQFWGKFLVLEANQRKTRDGKDIVNLRIGDTTGEIDVVVWDTCNVIGQLEEGALVGLLGNTGVYNNKQQITAKRIKILEEDPTMFLKKPAQGIEKLIEEFESLINSISGPYLRQLLLAIFTEDIRKVFFKAPAARKIHHNYTGGLLEHTVSVARLCDKAAINYTGINRDVVVTGALLHDIGKIKEFEMKVAPRYTAEGRLFGHIVIGHELITKVIDEIKQHNEFPEKLEWMIKHLILSHHGSLEFGSPVVPLFPEAFLLCTMDNLDAKMFVFKDKISEANEEELFTAYDNFFGQIFFTYRYNEDEN